MKPDPIVAEMLKTRDAIAQRYGNEPDKIYAAMATTVRRAISRGASIMVTNADHSCIRELYSDVGHMYSVDRTSVLAGRAIHRRRTTELVVTSY